MKNTNRRMAYEAALTVLESKVHEALLMFTLYGMDAKEEACHAVRDVIENIEALRASGGSRTRVTSLGS